MNAVDWKCMCGATSNIYKHTITMAYLSTLDFQISCYRNVMTNTMYTLETSFNDLDTYDEKNSDFLSHLSASGEWVGTQNCSSGPRCLTSHCGLTTEHFQFYFRIKSFCFATEAHIQIQTNTDTEQLTHLFRFSSLHKLNSP